MTPITPEIKKDARIGLGAVLALVLAFAVGRWTAPAKVVADHSEVKTATSKTTEDKHLETDTNRDRHVETTRTEIERPDGTKEVTTKTTQDILTGRKTKEATETEIASTSTDSVKDHKESDKSKANLNVSLLAGLGIFGSEPHENPELGCHITRNILGPVTVGVWGFRSGLAGASIGLSF